MAGSGPGWADDPAAAGDLETAKISLTVNSRPVQMTIPVRRLLSDFLRDDLGLPGTHVGCEHGVCGACTIHLDGEAVRSCLMLAVSAEGRSITTVEGITPEQGLSPLQESFSACHALQCGFCTAGFLMTIEAADPNRHPTDGSIRDLLSGNLCRCTGYGNIVAAVRNHWGRGVDGQD